MSSVVKKVTLSEKRGTSPRVKCIYSTLHVSVLDKIHCRCNQDRGRRLRDSGHFPIFLVLTKLKLKNENYFNRAGLDRRILPVASNQIVRKFGLGVSFDFRTSARQCRLASFLAASRKMRKRFRRMKSEIYVKNGADGESNCCPSYTLQILTMI